MVARGSAVYGVIIGLEERFYRQLPLAGESQPSELAGNVEIVRHPWQRFDHLDNAFDR